MLKAHYEGLSAEEVIKQREQFGTNGLAEVEVETFWDKFKGNFEDPVIRILVVALIVEVIFFFMGHVEWFEPLGIGIAVLIATFVGTWSEFSNEQSFQKLQEEASRIKVKVYRGGHAQEISINDIVVGDYILVQTGDKVPVDGTLIDGHLSIDQSVLNGESEEAKKFIPHDEY